MGPTPPVWMGLRGGNRHVEDCYNNSLLQLHSRLDEPLGAASRNRTYHTMEVVRLTGPRGDLAEFLQEAMLSPQSFADVSVCCAGGQRFLAHRLVLSAASPFLQEVLQAHSELSQAEARTTLIVAGVEAPELAALLRLVYTGSAAVPRHRLEQLARAAAALRIRLPPAEEPRRASVPPPRRPQVANQVTASPWRQIARPGHHSPKPPRQTQEPCRCCSLAPASQSKPELSLPVSRLCDNLDDEPPVKSDDNNNNEAPREDEHKCEQCGTGFDSEASLKVHVRSHSAGSSEKPFRCCDCGKQFSQLRNYKYHRSVHEGTREFAASCDICGKYFNDRGYLSSHMKIHRNRKEYACQECGKSFNQRVAYNMHVRIHTGLKPHQCEQCGKAFSRKMLLKQHLRTHSGERPYQCQVCQKRFADRSNMTLHTRLHSGLKPYQCHLCAKAFAKKHHLNTHLNYHTGSKPYACPNCQLRFSQSSNMRTHYKKCACARQAHAPSDAPAQA